MNEKTCRAIVYERANERCEVRVIGFCFGGATNYQHRKNRKHCTKTELWAPSNGLHVCGSGTTGCHGFIHANPKIAYGKGWMVHSWNTPADVPVMLHDNTPVFLGDDGSYRTPEPGELIDTMRLAYPGGE